MSMFEYLDPILGRKRKGDETDPFVPITETVQVNNNATCLLSEIPDRLARVNIPNMVEIDKVPETGLNPNEFYVDYVMGVIHVHPSLIGQSLTPSYMGTGGYYFPASRIWTKTSDGINVDETLETLMQVSDNFSHKGVYDPSKQYYSRNIVNYQGSTYMCVADAPIGTPPTNDNYWRKISAFAYKGVYSSSETYEFGDFVKDQNNEKLYMCIAETATGIPLSDTNAWELLISVSEAVANANAAANNANTAASNANSVISSANDATIAANDAATNANNAATNANNAATNANNAANNAQNLVNTLKHLGEWNSEIQYEVNNEVSYLGSTYRCIVTPPIGTLPTDTNYWTLVASAGSGGDMYKNVYDSNDDGKVNVADNADNLGGQPPSYYATQSNLTDVDNKIGLLSNLLTTDKTNIISAINEKHIEIENLNKKTDGVVSVKEFGAKGDGITDDTLAIQTAIDETAENGGGIVYFPPGIYMIRGIARKSNVYLHGSGIGSTILKLISGANNHVIDGEGVVNSAIRFMTIDGNRINQSLQVHGIRSGGDELFFIENVKIIETAHYGIGLQNGTLKDIFIRDIVIENVGGDGIDIKDKQHNNENVFLNRIRVKNFGLNTSLIEQAGIDVRGRKVILSDIKVEVPDRDQRGIRFRDGDNTSSNGYGGHFSVLSNFVIKGTGGTSSLGLYIPANNVKIMNGEIDGTYYGVIVSDAKNQLSNITIQNTGNYGINFTGNATNCKLVNSTIQSAGEYGIRISTFDIRLIGVTVNGCTNEALRLTTGAGEVTITDCDFTGNAGAVSNAAGITSIHARNVKGFVTESYVLSNAFPIDSTGTKVITINHGLAATPNIENIMVTLVRDTAVTDHVIAFIHIETVTSTQVTARVRVTGASATSGATAKLAFHCRVYV